MKSEIFYTRIVYGCRVASLYIYNALIIIIKDVLIFPNLVDVLKSIKYFESPFEVLVSKYLTLSFFLHLTHSLNRHTNPFHIQEINSD